ncbi:MAG: site-specific integrase, partial [Planctomycetota bacterium]
MSDKRFGNRRSGADWPRRYLDYLSAEKGLAPNTIAAYRTDLNRLESAMGGRPLEGAREEDLRRALREMRVAGSSPRSVARWVVAVRGFFSHLVLENVIRNDPSANLEAPRTWHALPKTLTAEEVEVLLTAPDP